MSKIKLLILSDSPYSTTDTGYQIRNVFCKLPESQFETTILCPNDGGINQPFKVGTAKVYPVLGEGFGNVSVVREALSLAKPDIILLFTDLNAIQYVFNIDNEIRSKARLVAYDALESTPFVKHYKTYASGLDEYITYSPITSEILSKNDIQSSVIPFGLNTGEFRLLEDKEYETMKKQVLKDDLKNVVTFLWHNINNSRNRPLDVINAFKNAYDSKKEISLLMLFQGYEQDYVPVQQYIMDYAPQLPIIIDDQINSKIPLNAHYYMSDAYVSIPTVNKFEFGALKALATGKTALLSPTMGCESLRHTLDEELAGQKTGIGIISSQGVMLDGDSVVPYANNVIADTTELTEWMLNMPKSKITTSNSDYKPVIEAINEQYATKKIIDKWVSKLQEITGSESTYNKNRISVFQIK